MARNQALKLDFEKREKTGTGACRKIRAKNLIPVILYGPEYKEGLAGTVSAKVITPLANSARRDTTLIELAISDGTQTHALIRDVQRHPLTHVIRHIDLYQVVKGHKIRVEIPVRVVNADLSQGIKDGGLLTLKLRSLLVEVQPSDIPEEIVFDAQALAMGSEVFVKDLALPEGVSAIDDPEDLVLHITEVKEEAPEEETDEENKEVEVVAKGKAAKGEE